MTYDMATITEATSLSAVTSLAANPPPHPNAPSGVPKLPPLVLYIARVPGSRDVFLTPMKPREKVVSAEDVQSSLYYVHVNCESDFHAASYAPSSADTDASQLPAVSENTIRRKPILPKRLRPAMSLYPVDDDDASTPSRRTPSPPRLRQIARKPIVKDDLNGNPPDKDHSLDLPVLPPRPLPPPPRDELSYEKSLHSDSVRLLRLATHSPEDNPYDRLFPPLDPSFNPADLPPRGSLTLIRRDPSSYEQWNVALIHDPPIHEVSSAALRNPTAAARTKRGGAPLYLDISTPGYEQFLGREGRTGSSCSTASSESDRSPEGVFRRRLFMPGSRYGEHEYRRHSRFGSTDSAESVPHPQRLSPAAVDERRSKGYTFTSPWSGRCEFSTGATGKSLTCRHVLPSHYQRGGYDAPEVSELRFNLPTSSRTAEAVKQKRSSMYHGLHRRLRNTTSSGGMEDEDLDSPGLAMFAVGDDGKMDLTLGQERAGGGFGGKQAKLGKLIIQPEGMEMLDLLVAANVGLWWRAYERY